MRKATDIEAFVHKCFSLYGLDFKHFYEEIVGEQEDEDGNIFGGTFEPLPVALNDKVDEKLLDKIATTLGLPKDVLSISINGKMPPMLHRKSYSIVELAYKKVMSIIN